MRPPTPATVRFFAKVDRNGPVPSHRPELGPCHVWKASFRHGQYGGFLFQGKRHNAHRVAFHLAHGRWPEPFCCHRCDNAACVNPAHLFEGDHDANMADRSSKGRQAKGKGHGRHTKPECTARGDRNGARRYPERMSQPGERHGMAKLTEQDVRDIRANAALCRVSQRELALRYCVSQSAISRVVRGVRWSHSAV